LRRKSDHFPIVKIQIVFVISRDNIINDDCSLELLGAYLAILLPLGGSQQRSVSRDGDGCYSCCIAQRQIVPPLCFPSGSN